MDLVVRLLSGVAVGGLCAYGVWCLMLFVLVSSIVCFTGVIWLLLWFVLRFACAA